MAHANKLEPLKTVKPTFWTLQSCTHKVPAVSEHGTCQRTAAKIARNQALGGFIPNILQSMTRVRDLHDAQRRPDSGPAPADISTGSLGKIETVCDFRQLASWS